MNVHRPALAASALLALLSCARPSPPVEAPSSYVPAEAPRVPELPEATGPAQAAPDAAATAVDDVAEPNATPATVDAAVVRRGECFVRTISVVPCSGIPQPLPRVAYPVEVCDGCQTSADCRARRGGRCEEVRGNTCSPAMRACRYPGDACSRCPGRPTFESAGCVNDHAGHAVCALLAAPPPSSPH